MTTNIEINDLVEVINGGEWPVNRVWVGQQARVFGINTYKLGERDVTYYTLYLLAPDGRTKGVAAPASNVKKVSA